MTDGDHLVEQASALKQARESLRAVLAGHPDWVELTALDAAGAATPGDVRMRLEQTLSGVPAFVALRQVDDALAGIEAEIASTRPIEQPAPTPAEAEPVPVAPQLELQAAREPPADPSPSLSPTVPEDISADDLTRIRGIDAAIASRLGAHGVTRFEQIAGWWPADVRRFGEELGIGRAIVRQSWVTQAELLMRQRPLAETPTIDAPSAFPPPATPNVAEMTEPAPAAVGTPVGPDSALAADTTVAAGSTGATESAEPEQPAGTREIEPAEAPGVIEVFEPIETARAEQAHSEHSVPQPRDDVEQAEPIRLTQIVEAGPLQKADLDVIDATFTPAPGDGMDAAPIQSVEPARATTAQAASNSSTVDGVEPPAPQRTGSDDLAEILALIRHSSALGTTGPAQSPPKSRGLAARIDAVREETVTPRPSDEPITLVAIPTEDARRLPALGEPERAVLASLDRLAAPEPVVDAVTRADAPPNPIGPSASAAYEPLPPTAPELRAAPRDDAEAEVEIVHRAQPAPSPLVPQRAVEPAREPPAFVGAEEASVVIVRRVAGEAAPALPFYAHKPPETQSTVRRFMSALTGPAAKPPE